jgi:hypothetical protein
LVDLQALRRTIEESPGAIVTRRWLEDVERDLAELAERRRKEARA